MSDLAKRIVAAVLKELHVQHGFEFAHIHFNVLSKELVELEAVVDGVLEPPTVDLTADTERP